MDALLTAQECRQILRIGKTLWHRLRAAGRLPRPVTLASALRWRRRDIERLMETGVGSTRATAPRAMRCVVAQQERCPADQERQAKGEKAEEEEEQKKPPAQAGGVAAHHRGQGRPTATASIVAP